MSRIFHLLPEPFEHEDHPTYFNRVRFSSQLEDAPVMELMDATRLKINQAAAKKLFARIVESEDMLALREAVALLLKETYRL